MSDLKEGAVEYDLDDVDIDKQLDRLSESKADFEYWVNMPFWTLDESIALFLDKDPKIVTWDTVGAYVNYHYSSDLCEEYAKLRMLFLRALEARELQEYNSPMTLLAWAKIRNLKVPEALQRQMNQRKKLVLYECPADFEHWTKMPFWTLYESIALLLDKDPKTMTWKGILACSDQHYSSDLCSEYTKLRTLLLRALEAKELEESNSPATFLAWAKIKDLKIPEALQQKMARRNQSPTKEDLQAQEIEDLKSKIKGLQDRVAELEELEASIFDESRPTYAPELPIAVKAHQAISQDWEEGSSVKNQLMVWVKQFYSALSESARERIGMVSNWDKIGGSPVTPSKS
ncbi:MAG: hypothetical protein KBD23_04880 [Gammaproteobacteria bacterium]|nr:hypothetical protein [Gammaproteobacteria bacterium]